MNNYITRTIIKLLIFNFFRSMIKIKYFNNNNIITLIYRPIKNYCKTIISIIIRIFFILLTKLTLKFLYQN